MRAIKPKEVRAPSRRRLSLAAEAPGAGSEPTRPELPARELEAAAGVASALPATFTARLIAVDDRGQGWVAWSDEGAPAGPETNARTQPARSTVALAAEHVGREVLVCRAGSSARVVIVGLLIGVEDDAAPLADPSIDLVVERRRIVLSASSEVVLRCGAGSVTLGADGKVTIRGLDIVSTAARTQRIRGGAVRIN